jgi:hypothetical protein
MDLHFVTLALGEANFSCFNRRIISSGKPAMLASETTQRTPAPLDRRVIGDDGC